MNKQSEKPTILINQNNFILWCIIMLLYFNFILLKLKARLSFSYYKQKSNSKSKSKIIINHYKSLQIKLTLETNNIFMKLNSILIFPLVILFLAGLFCLTRNEFSNNSFNPKSLISAWGDHQEANVSYNEAIRLSALEEYQASVSYFKLTIQLNQTFVEAYQGLANSLFCLQDYEGAKVNAEKAISLDYNCNEAYNILGNVLNVEQQYQKALVLYIQSLFIDPTYPNPYNGLGVIARKTKKNNQAIQSFEKAIQLDPNYYKAYQNIGNILLQQKKYEQAQPYFKKVLLIHPKCTSALQGLASVYSGLNKYNQKLKVYEQLIKLSKNQINMQTIQNFAILANLYQIQEQPQKAVNIYIRLFQSKIQPYSSNAYSSIKQILISKKSHEQAVKLYEMFFYDKQNSSFYSIWKDQSKNQIIRNLKNIISKNQNFTKEYGTKYGDYNRDQSIQTVISKFNKSIQIIFSYQDIFDSLGLLYLGINQEDKAKSAYLKALQINQNYTQSLRGLAYIYKNEGEFQQALILYEKALKLESCEKWQYIELSQLFKVMEKYSQAKLILKKAIQLDNLQIYFYRQMRMIQNDENDKTHNQTVFLLLNTLQQNAEWRLGFIELAKIYKQQGEFQKILEITKYLNEPHFDNRTNDYYLYWKCNSIMQQMKIINQTIQKFKNAINNHSKDMLEFQTFAYIFEQHQMVQYQINSYQKILEINPQKLYVLSNLGDIFYFKLNNYTKALHYYQRYAQINSNSTYINLKLAKTLLKLNYLARSNQIITNVLSQQISNNQKCEGLYILSQINQKLQKSEQVENIYHEVIKNQNCSRYKHVQVYQKLADIQLDKSNFDEAYKYYRLARLTVSISYQQDRTQKTTQIIKKIGKVVKMIKQSKVNSENLLQLQKIQT